MNGEIAFLLEMLVAEHLLREVAEFDIQAEFVRQLLLLCISHYQYSAASGEPDN